MRVGNYRNGETSDNQICDVYLRSDFVVTAGLNAGDGITGPSESSLGDVYEFSGHAIARDMIVNDGGTAAGGLSAVNSVSATDHRNAVATDVGTLGDDLKPESRLTFCGADGSTVDVLIIANSNSAADPVYFLPLSPLDATIEYTLVRVDSEPGEFRYADYTCVCFAAGTLIRVQSGEEKLVQDLKAGDLVQTQDNGAQPVRWVGSRTARALGHLAPVVISKNALGNHSDLIVSQLHRVQLSDWRAEVMLGARDVLVKAKDLINGDTIYRREGGVVEYFHILFDTHEIIYAEGTACESLSINKSVLDGLTEDNRKDVIKLFPDIETNPQNSAVASRMSLRSCEATALLKQVGFR